MKIAAANCQQELVATYRCAVWRDRAYERLLATSPAG